MSVATADKEGTPRTQSSARLGLTLRSIALNPRLGFDAALKLCARRARAGVVPAEGKAPYVLAFFGGGAAMLLWLKVGAALGLRDVARASFREDFLIVSVAVGGILSLVAQLLWGAAGSGYVKVAGGATTARALRLVWGAATLPQLGAWLVLLPLDLVIVGPDSFTTERLVDPVSALWTALSIALAVSLAAWSLFLFQRGLEVAGGLTWPRALGGIVAAAVVVGLLVAGASIGAAALAGVA